VLGFATGWLPPHTKALALAAHSEERRFEPLLKPLLRRVVKLLRECDADEVRLNPVRRETLRRNPTRARLSRFRQITTSLERLLAFIRTRAV
jgi:hypothetical protein